MKVKFLKERTKKATLAMKNESDDFHKLVKDWKNAPDA